MRYILLLTILVALFITSCGTTSRFNKTEAEGKSKPLKKGAVIEKGRASWYGPKFHGKLTANGEKYDMYGLTAAHRTLPFNTILEVQNLDNNKSVQVRINDRGPYAKDRIIDLSKKAAQKIEMLGPGTANVKLVLMSENLAGPLPQNLKVPTYTVQLASYKKENKAFSHSQKIKGARVETVNLQKGTVYRVYYGVYTDKTEARQNQRKLKRKGYEGYVKQIEN
ncbi:septal ring lytic transglycosylase RlpA family protein [Fodinibius saliphilus]|uniref:septal ring lytic transglycosylase RlpA family protein n=1 Tax=Fodinibius saliphilus TaxID=1920650 RepID=UPI0024825872|nr:septal ring lytic transglycosylase RlpA family protein [Fodinibius saliphilus]